MTLGTASCLTPVVVGILGHLWDRQKRLESYYSCQFVSVGAFYFVSSDLPAVTYSCVGKESGP